MPKIYAFFLNIKFIKKFIFKKTHIFLAFIFKKFFYYKCQKYMRFFKYKFFNKFYI